MWASYTCEPQNSQADMAARFALMRGSHAYAARIISRFTWLHDLHVYEVCMISRFIWFRGSHVYEVYMIPRLTWFRGSHVYEVHMIEELRGRACEPSRPLWRLGPDALFTIYLRFWDVPWFIDINGREKWNSANITCLEFCDTNVVKKRQVMVERLHYEYISSYLNMLGKQDRLCPKKFTYPP